MRCIEQPSNKERLLRLEETIQIIRKMWTEEPTASFNGKYYQIHNAYCNPKPIQKPQMWFIPDSGELYQGHERPQLVKQFESDTNAMLDNFDNMNWGIIPCSYFCEFQFDDLV